MDSTHRNIFQIYEYLKQYIEKMVPIGKDPERQLMMDGILLSIISDRYVHLTGLDGKKRDMQDRLCRMVINGFPEYLSNQHKFAGPYINSLTKFLDGLRIKSK